MSYTIYKGEVNIAGKSKKLGSFRGKILQIKDIKNIEKVRNPRMSEGVIEQNIRTSYVRLESDKRVVINCYITQRSQRKFSKGGYGVCYAENGEVFDIVVIAL